MRWTAVWISIVALIALVGAGRAVDPPRPHAFVPPPTGVDAEFDPDFRVMAISWDEPPSQVDPGGFRYRYRREGADWSAWRSTGFAGIDLHHAHDREAVEIEVRTRDRTGDLSAVTRARVVGVIPATFDCKPHPYGAYPSKCVADSNPPMGD